MGPLESIIPPFIVLILSIIGAGMNRNRASTLVVQKFSLSKAPRATAEPAVEIVGRMQGVIAFVLSLMGYSPVTRFTIAGAELRCESSSLFGRKFQQIPLRCVATMAAGIHKPIAALILAVFFVILGFSMYFSTSSLIPLAIFGALSAISGVAYFFSKKFFIEVYPQGGPAISLLFRPNVIEGVPIDAERAFAVVSVISDLIVHMGNEPRAASTKIQPWATDDDRVEAWTAEPEHASDRAEDDADALLAQAKAFAQSGNRDQAISTLRDIIRRFPKTVAAQQARKNLERSGISPV